VPQPPSPVNASLKLELSAYFANEPAQVIANMRVAPDVRAQSLTIEWWTADGVGGSHLISIEGDRGPVRYAYPISRMTQGEYIVTAELRREDGTSVRQRRRVFVLGEAMNGPIPIISEDSLE
jgi:hypothetical protein